MSAPPGQAPRLPWSGAMAARHPGEAYRHPTVLELFFDLCFVVAVAQAASGLHHAVSADHVADGVWGYLLVFFAIWWAWMNFTWFASAYDTDDIAYRLTTFVQIAGALVFAAGVPGWRSTSTTRSATPRSGRSSLRRPSASRSRCSWLRSGSCTGLRTTSAAGTARWRQ